MDTKKPKTDKCPACGCEYNSKGTDGAACPKCRLRGTHPKR